MTEQERLIEALKILGIIALGDGDYRDWYRNGDYLGTYGVKDGLRALRTITSFVKAERDGD